MEVEVEKELDGQREGLDQSLHGPAQQPRTVPRWRADLGIDDDHDD